MAQRDTRGVVEKKFTKDWFDSRAKQNIVLHSFRLEGDKTYFRTGTDPIPANEGDAVQFSYDDRSGNVDMGTFAEAEASTVERAPPAPRRNTGGRSGSYSGGGSSVGGAGSSRDNYWKDKEDRDIAREARYQEVVEPRMVVMAAQERAVGVVAAALANDCLSFGNTAKGLKFEMLLGFVDEATDHFIKQALNATELCNAVATEDEPAMRSRSEGYSDD